MLQRGFRHYDDDLGYRPEGELKQRLNIDCMSDDQLASPLPEDFKTFAPSLAALPSSIAWHEGMHSGQLTMIRKSLGIGRKFA